MNKQVYTASAVAVFIPTSHYATLDNSNHLNFLFSIFLDKLNLAFPGLPIYCAKLPSSISFPKAQILPHTEEKDFLLEVVKDLPESRFPNPISMKFTWPTFTVYLLFSTSNFIKKCKKATASILLSIPTVKTFLRESFPIFFQENSFIPYPYLKRNRS